jgi:hypothetical protein
MKALCARFVLKGKFFFCPHCALYKPGRKMINETGQAGDQDETEITEEQLLEGINALNQVDPKDWADAVVSTDEIVRAICGAMRVRVAVGRPEAISGELPRRLGHTFSQWENLLKQ